MATVEMTQSEFVLRYLQTGRSISQAKAQAEYNIYRLAAVIHRLRNAGHRINTFNKRSVRGRPYAEYCLA